MSQADVADPECIRSFRRRLTAFLAASDTALGGSVNGLQRLQEELRSELQAHWKAQLRRREEAYEETRRRYLMARAEVDAASRGRGGGKQSCDEERLDMDRARRRRDEAEDKLKAIQRWLLRLHQDGEPLAALCRNHALSLGELGATAERSLDRMVSAIDAYQDRTGGGP